MHKRKVNHSFICTVLSWYKRWLETDTDKNNNATGKFQQPNCQNWHMDNWFVSWKGSIRWLPVRILGFLVAHTGDIQVEWESARIYSAKRQKSNWQFDSLIDIFFWYAIAVNWTFSNLHREWNPMSNWLNRFVSHLQFARCKITNSE